VLVKGYDQAVAHILIVHQFSITFVCHNSISFRICLLDHLTSVSIFNLDKISLVV